MSKDWNCHKARLKRLYLEEDRTLGEVKELLEDKYGFIASTRAYRMKFDEWDFRKYKSLKNPKVRYVSPKRANRTRKSTTSSTELHQITTLRRTVGLEPVQQNRIFSTTSPTSALSSVTLQSPTPSLLSTISPAEASLYPELHLPHFTCQNSFTNEPMRTIHIRAGRMSASELSGLLGVDSQHAIEAFFMKWQNDGDYLTEVLKRIRKTQVAGHILNPTIYGSGNIFNLLQERVPAKDHRVLIAAIAEAYTAIIRDTEKRGLEINASWYIYNLTLERLVRNILTVDSAYSSPFNSL